MRKLSSGWYLLAWVAVGFLNLLSGYISNRVDLIVLGAVLVLADTSAYLTSYVKSGHRVKKAFDVIFGLLALGVSVYGFIVTRNLILGFITLGFVVILFVLAYVVTRLPPPVSIKLKVHFFCSVCGTHFEVSGPRLLITRRFSGYAQQRLPYPWPDPTTIHKVAYYLKCPRCGKKSWLTPEKR